jgi:hypothetical protein
MAIPRRLFPTPPEGYVFCPTCEQIATTAQIAPEGICVACVAELQCALASTGMMLRTPRHVIPGKGDGNVAERHLARVVEHMERRSAELRHAIEKQTRELLAKRQAEVTEERAQQRAEEQERARIAQTKRSAADLREALAHEEQVLRDAGQPTEAAGER